MLTQAVAYVISSPPTFSSCCLPLSSVRITNLFDLSAPPCKATRVFVEVATEAGFVATRGPCRAPRACGPACRRASTFWPLCLVCCRPLAAGVPPAVVHGLPHGFAPLAVFHPAPAAAARQALRERFAWADWLRGRP
jgi:hypothetical protein